MEPTPVDVLKNALELVRDVGWIKDQYMADEDQDPGYCTLGAITTGVPEELRCLTAGELFTKKGTLCRDLSHMSRRIVEGIITEQYPGYFGDSPHPNVAKWNDDPKRTHEEVIAVFEKAVARAEEIYC